MAYIEISIPDYHVDHNAILKNIELTLEQGKTYSLIGLNGAGKTTLIRLLLNFTYLQSGHISIKNTTVDKPESRNDIYYLPEKFFPPEFFTGKEYLDYICEAYSVDLDKAKQRSRYQELATSIDLDTAALDKKMKDYSKGMMQKIGIISAVLSNKAIWILDEPMSGLDPKARYLFMQLIQQAKAEGKTILLSSHMLTDIETISDELIIINEGKVQFTGTVEPLLKLTNTTSVEKAFLHLIKAV